MKIKKYITLKPFNNRIFYKNGIFDEKSVAGSVYLIAARKLLAKHNIQMNTIDVPIAAQTEQDIYMEVPYPWELGLWMRIVRNRNKNVLFIAEPPIVNPFNFMNVFHAFFYKIFTWNDNLVDGMTYFKYFLPKAKKGIQTKQIPFANKKLLTMMNGHLLPFLPFRLLSISTRELYTERVKAIEFFDAYHSSDFFLYGRGWNSPERFSIWQRLFGCKKYTSYQGTFAWKDKYTLLSGFKFCICFENSEVTGYISEKIFDCLKAKCVPVYRGAPNIGDFIPQNCFIDARKFRDYESLYDFLRSMKKDEYDSYMSHIETLLNNKQFQDRWFEDGFARTFLAEVNIAIGV